jgi:hypothetical protein
MDFLYCSGVVLTPHNIEVVSPSFGGTSIIFMFVMGMFCVFFKRKRAGFLRPALELCRP